MNVYLNLKKTSWATLLLGCLVLVSCKSDELLPVLPEVRDEQGVLLTKNPIWITDVSKSGHVPTLMPPVLYENRVVFGGSQQNGNGRVVALDIDTGEELWEWTSNHRQSEETFLLNEQGQNIYGSTWIIQDNAHFFAVDLNRGEVLWKDYRPGNGNRSEPQVFDNSYYFFLAYNTDSVPSLFKGNVFDNSFERILSPSIDSIKLTSHLDVYGGMYKSLIFAEEGKRYVFLQFVEDIDFDQYLWDYYVSLYNMSDRRYVFDKIKLSKEDVTNSSPFQGRPVLYNNTFIVNVDDKLAGIHKHTGEIMWERQYRSNGDGYFSFRIVDNRLIAVNKLGSEDRAIALNPETGLVIWETLGIGGGASPLNDLNGVVYFTNRADGKLYALDAQTGKLLWNIRSPDLKRDWGARWTSEGVAVVPGKNGEKGKVIVSSFLNVYCFEAAR